MLIYNSKEKISERNILLEFSSYKVEMSRKQVTNRLCVVFL